MQDAVSIISKFSQYKTGLKEVLLYNKKVLFYKDIKRA